MRRSPADGHRAIAPSRAEGAAVCFSLPAALRRPFDPEDPMQKSDGKKKQKCKNCEGKGTLKKGDKVVRCQRCDGTGIKR